MPRSLLATVAAAAALVAVPASAPAAEPGMVIPEGDYQTTDSGGGTLSLAISGGQAIVYSAGSAGTPCVEPMAVSGPVFLTICENDLGTESRRSCLGQPRGAHDAPGPDPALHDCVYHPRQLVPGVDLVHSTSACARVLWLANWAGSAAPSAAGAQIAGTPAVAGSLLSVPLGCSRAACRVTVVARDASGRLGARHETLLRRGEKRTVKVRVTAPVRRALARDGRTRLWVMVATNGARKVRGVTTRRVTLTRK